MEPVSLANIKVLELSTFGLKMINWNEPATQNFVTQVYNFNSNNVTIFVISKYGSDRPYLGFQVGIIEHIVKRYSNNLPT